MKKALCITCIILVLIGCLSSCSFTHNASGSIAGEAESATQFGEMLTALTEKRIANAEAFLHPQMPETSKYGIEQISAYFAGRKAISVSQVNINVKSSVGTSGKVRQEQVTYQVSLSGGESVYLSTVYLTNNSGEGFISFQLVLGVI